MEMKKRRERIKLTNLPKAQTIVRSKDYRSLRYYWLGELAWLRAKRRNGTASTADLKAAQRALAKVRQTEQ